MDLDPAFHFDPDPDCAFRFGPDPDPYCFKEICNVPKTILFIHLNLIFLVSRSTRAQPEGILF